MLDSSSSSDDEELSISHLPTAEIDDLDFMSSKGLPDIEFGYDSDDEERNSEAIEEDNASTLEDGEGSSSETNEPLVPVTERRRSSASAFSKVTLYIQMELCEGQVSNP